MKLRILLSAYACEPGKGSEPGVGWHWANEMAALGHEVWVLTRSNNQTAIEAALAASPQRPQLRFVYYDLPNCLLWLKRRGLPVQMYYALWQFGVLRTARELHERIQFHAVQHLTFGGFRTPSQLWKLGVPFVFGPVGGGERAPMALRRDMGWRPHASELLRDLLLVLARANPMLRRCLRESALILCKTDDTRQVLPGFVRARAKCQLEIGINTPPQISESGEPQRASGECLRLLFVGRFVHLKGGAIAVRALTEALDRGAEATLTLVGKGPEEARWRRLVAAAGIEHRIQWHPWLSQAELQAVYQSHDALLFPSLHDSSGNVVLEALSHGLPVVCLDLGGPPRIVDHQSAIVVRTRRRAYAQVVGDVGTAIVTLSKQPEVVRDKSRGAELRAQSLSWAQTVGRIWQADSLAAWFPTGSTPFNQALREYPAPRHESDSPR